MSIIEPVLSLALHGELIQLKLVLSLIINSLAARFRQKVKTARPFFGHAGELHTKA